MSKYPKSIHLPILISKLPFNLTNFSYVFFSLSIVPVAGKLATLEHGIPMLRTMTRTMIVSRRSQVHNRIQISAGRCTRIIETWKSRRSTKLMKAAVARRMRDSRIRVCPEEANNTNEKVATQNSEAAASKV